MKARILMLIGGALMGIPIGDVVLAILGCGSALSWELSVLLFVLGLLVTILADCVWEIEHGDS